MPRKTCFNKNWLTSGAKDNNGDYVSDSYSTDVKLDIHSANCKICKKHFSISNMGLGQIISHSASVKHVSNVNNLKGQTRFHIEKHPTIPVTQGDDIHTQTSAPCTNSTDQSGPTISSTVSDVVLMGPEMKSGKVWIPIHLDDKVKKAEILFALKLSTSNY